MNELDKKIQSSIRLLKALDGLEPELAYSGGKDSDVILALAQMSGIKFHPIYKMTTIDPPGTIPHVKSKGVEIYKPDITFFEVIRQHGMPNSNYRVCCGYLKEYKILDKAILGIRKDESTKRKKRYKEPTQCRIYNKKDRVEQFFPILNWTNDDISTFVNHYGIQCAPLYYDENGNFDVTQRLGCMCCPLRADKGLAHFKQYPKFVRLWIRGGYNSLIIIEIAKQQRNMETHTTDSSQRYSANHIKTTSTRRQACSGTSTPSNGLRITSR